MHEELSGFLKLAGCYIKLLCKFHKKQTFENHQVKLYFRCDFENLVQHKNFQKLKGSPFVDTTLAEM